MNYIIIENFLSGVEIVEFEKSFIEQGGEVFNAGYAKLKIKYLDKFKGEVQTTKDKIYQAGLDNAHHLGYSKSLIGKMGYCYNNYEIDNKYMWHIDLIKDKNIKEIRVITIVVTINSNSEYDGGEFHLSNSVKVDRKIKRKRKFKNILTEEDNIKLGKAGTAIIFPSKYFHALLPVTNGIRKSIASWIKYKPEYEGIKYKSKVGQDKWVIEQF